MAEKILYYLGAGASAKELPLARTVWNNNVNPALVHVPGLAYELEHFDFIKLEQNLDSEEEKEIIIDIKNNFKTLAANANEFGDVDTYAKYLKLMYPDGVKLTKLKQTLVQYFVIKQVILKSQDSRYLPWLVSIMSNKIFPPNIKIISWNYDFQVQLASNPMGSKEDIEYSMPSISYSAPWLSYFPNLDFSFSDYGNLSLIHLNGIAGFVKNEYSQAGSIFHERYQESKEKILSFLSNEKLQNNIHFAWEKNGYHEVLMKHVEKMIRDTNIMVVIGYSFPFFNREIDKKIFDILTGATNFRKIYYQDPMLDGQQLKSQFGLPADFNVAHIKSTDNFYIPFEY